MYLLTYPLFLLSHFVPKKHNLWIFGSWGGVKYNDNSKYVFEYVNESCDDIKAVWLTKSKSTLQVVREKGYECHLMYSIKGVIYAVRSRIAFISQSKTEDLPLYINPYKTSIVQLWHGTPLKKIGADSHAKVIKNKGVFSKILNFIKRYFFPQIGNYYSAFIVSSPEVAKIIDSAYGSKVKPGMIKVTGYPRNDALLNNADNLNSGEFKVIYMPTYRDGSKDAVDLFDKYGFNISEVNKQLCVNNVTFDIKLHPQAAISDAFIQSVNKSSNIKIVNYLDIYAELGKYDLLITDYSSIFSDYLLLDRPIIFAPFDLNEYESLRGMYFNYDEITPGVKAFNWSEVMRGVFHALANKSSYANERKIVRERFNHKLDNKNCKRVVEMARHI